MAAWIWQQMVLFERLHALAEVVLHLVETRAEFDQLLVQFSVFALEFFRLLNDLAHLVFKELKVGSDGVTHAY